MSLRQPRQLDQILVVQHGEILLYIVLDYVDYKANAKSSRVKKMLCFYLAADTLRKTLNKKKHEIFKSI